MRFRVGSRTDIGRARQRNEDSLLVRDPLYAVADGIGGHRGGDVASHLAIETLEQAEPTADLSADGIVQRIKEANRRIVERGEADRALRGMGTTMTALIATDDKAHLAHVGDSRAYLLRDGAFQQLSEDHTLVQRMVRDGKISPDEAFGHPQRSILTRALGSEDSVDVDVLTLDLHEGDRLLLCTDGLSGLVQPEEIQAVLEEEPDPQRACNLLVEAANEAGGDDNITVIIVDALRPEDHRSSGDGDSAGVSTPVAVAKTDRRPGPAAEEEPAGAERRGRGKRRLIAWIAVVVVLVVAAIFGFRAYVHHQWFVGESGDRVAIYNGIPTTVAGFRLSHVAHLTELSAPAVERLRTYGDLKSGITTNINSRRDAEALVTQMRQDLQRSGGQ
jgi:serine/threonine protein phosphatase PrpC